jgi:hypothetical protein
MREPGLWSELSLAGRERVLATFTQAGVARKTVEVYRAMVAAG